MDGAIASCHWGACSTCEWFKDGCQQQGTMEVKLDPYTDSIICTEYKDFDFSHASGKQTARERARKAIARYRARGKVMKCECGAMSTVLLEEDGEITPKCEQCYCDPKFTPEEISRGLKNLARRQPKAQQPDYLTKALGAIKEISMTALGQAEARERILLDALKNIGGWKKPYHEFGLHRFVTAFGLMKQSATKALADHADLKHKQEQG